MLSRSVGQSSFFAVSLKGRQGVLPETPKESSRASDDTQKNRKSEFLLRVFSLIDEKSKNRLKTEVSLLEFKKKKKTQASRL